MTDVYHLDLFSLRLGSSLLRSAPLVFGIMDVNFVLRIQKEQTLNCWPSQNYNSVVSRGFKTEHATNLQDLRETFLKSYY